MNNINKDNIDGLLNSTFDNSLIISPCIYMFNAERFYIDLNDNFKNVFDIVLDERGNFIYIKDKIWLRNMYVDINRQLIDIFKKRYYKRDWR